jgi:uncharacterized protein
VADVLAHRLFGRYANGRGGSVVALYVTFVAGAEVSTAFVSSLAGAIEYALLLIVMLTHAVIRLAPERDGSATRKLDLAHALIALSFLPLIRLVSLTAPVGGGSETARYLIVGGLVFLAIVWAASAVGLPGVDLRPRSPVLQFVLIWLGVPLVLGGYFAIGPASIASGERWTQLAAAACAVALAAVVEELIFRGFIQSAFARLYGATAAPVCGAAVYVLFYTGVRPVGMVAFAAILGLLFAWSVQRTQTLLGVTLSHSVVNVGLLVLLPHAASASAT